MPRSEKCSLRSVRVCFQDAPSDLTQPVIADVGDPECLQFQPVGLDALVFLHLHEAGTDRDLSGSENLWAVRTVLRPPSSPGRAVIGIAHRLDTAHDADRIAVIDGGRVAELGRHHRLLERDGAYARLRRSRRGTAAA